jgi:Ricin-type beta-trefoil lectin domain/Putative Ig domain
MKNRLAVIIAALAVVLGGAASSAVASTERTLPPPVHQINLHAAYARALPNVTHGPIAYGTRPRGAKVNHSVNAASCTEPNCAVPWNGGQVQHTPKVWVLLWGPNWSSTGADTAYVGRFYAGLGASPDSWSTITSQYGDTTGHPTFTGGVLANGSLYQDFTTPPTGVTPTNLAAEAYGFEQAEGITDLANTQIIIASQQGTTFSDGFGTAYCGWHTYVVVGTTPNVPFINLPYQPDAGVGCGSAYGTDAGFSIVGGHEYGETIPDPFLNAWYDPADNTNDGGGEIADKCAWFDPVTGNPDIQTVTLATGSFPTQPLFSNAQLGRTGDGCTITSGDTVTIANPGIQTTTLGAAVSLPIHATSSLGETLTYSASGLPTGLAINASTGLITGTASATGSFPVTVTATAADATPAFAPFYWNVVNATDVVTITNPGTQSGRVGASVSLQIHASSSLGQTLTYSATGLPAGLAINAATGLITGKPTTVRSTTAAVTATDTSGAHASASFTWNVSATGAITGYGGKCVSETGFAPPNGSAVIYWTCRGQTNQVWTLQPSGALTGLGGKCVSEYGTGSANGTKVILWTCLGQRNQHWTRLSNSEYQLANNHLCLNLPGYKTTNGTQLILWTCVNTPNEHWSLP